MGNITRYLGVARVHMSLQRRCPKSYLSVKHRRIASRITVFCADAKFISMIDAVTRSRIHTNPLSPATVVDLTVEGCLVATPCDAHVDICNAKMLAVR